jgi:aminopeptidase-like protein
MTYKRSRRGDADIDRVAQHVLRRSGHAYLVVDFDPYGYDERQYCSPGFNLPVGRLSKTLYGAYPEYHTSADNLDFVHPESLGESFSRLVDIVRMLECNRAYVSMNPRCEPQLGKRGLYSSAGTDERALLWVLNYSDGHHDLLDIAERSGFDFSMLENAAENLLKHHLIRQSRPVLMRDDPGGCVK